MQSQSPASRDHLRIRHLVRHPRFSDQEILFLLAQHLSNSSEYSSPLRDSVLKGQLLDSCARGHEGTIMRSIDPYITPNCSQFCQELSERQAVRCKGSEIVVSKLIVEVRAFFSNLYYITSTYKSYIIAAELSICLSYQQSSLR